VHEQGCHTLNAIALVSLHRLETRGKATLIQDTRGEVHQGTPWGEIPRDRVILSL
jgi:hypothetical protein